MLKIRKSKVKVVGVITFLSLLSVSYVELSFYSIPEKANAATGIEEWRIIEDISTMQEMTTEICNNTDVGYGKKLQDVRDGSEYYIQKLTDGNCWMLQNLKLTREGIEEWKKSHIDSENNIKLSSKYSNVADDSTFTMPMTISSLNSGSTSQFGTNSHYNTTAQIYNPSETANGRQKGYGAYYNWYAATAGMGNTSVIANGTDVDYSICPKGWRLPTSKKSSSTVEYEYSFNKLTIDQLTGETVLGDRWLDKTYTNVELNLANSSGYLLSGGFFSAAGSIVNGSIGVSAGSIGHYWSSTAYDNNLAYNLAFNYTIVDPAPANDRYNGYSVRCLANPAIHSDPIPPTDERHTDVAVHVGPTISIDAVTSLYGEVDYTKVLEDNITATVSSNNPYKLLLSAAQTSLLDATQPDNTGIPTVTTTQAIEKGISAWGIYSGNVDTENNKTYDPIKTTPSKYYYTDAIAADGAAITSSFGIAIAVSPSIPNGTYSTSVTVTAVNG